VSSNQVPYSHLADSLARNGDYLIKSRKGVNKAISRVQAYRIIVAAAEALAFASKVSCHSLRKTFGYHAWKNGISPAVKEFALRANSWKSTTIPTSPSPAVTSASPKTTRTRCIADWRRWCRGISLPLWDESTIQNIVLCWTNRLLQCKYLHGNKFPFRQFLHPFERHTKIVCHFL
jgi:hypothetical protein